MNSLAIDTNVLVYAEGVERVAEDAVKVVASRVLMRRLLEARVRPVIAVQALAELHNVLVSRRRLSPRNASQVVEGWIGRAEIVASSDATLIAALDLAGDHGLRIFDAMIVAAAVEARCDLLLSEDLQDGFAWRGVVITNPFAEAADRRLTLMLAGGG